jgi:NAD(P)H-dependent FMN reductase
MTETPHVLTILCSTRAQRRGEPIARWFVQIAAERQDITCELVDLAEADLPFLTTATPPTSPDSREAAARSWASRIEAADGFVLVVPEYNHGYPAAVKNALDHLFTEWNHKPIGFVSYGGLSGGVRAVEQLRQIAVELDMVPVRRQVSIQRIWAAIAEDGALREPPADQARGLLDDMAWWAKALREGRAATVAAA